MEIDQLPPLKDQVAYRGKRDAVVSQIQSNMEDSQPLQEDEQASASDQEQEQLDAAVSTLDPIKEIRLKREQEKLEIERLKEKERQEDRIKKLQKAAADGDEQARRELDLVKKKQGEEAIKITGDTIKGIQDQATHTAKRVGDTVGGVWDSIGRVATPGSIWLPLAVLLIFFFLLLPVNGYTRMQWLFLALTGQATIQAGGLGGGGGGTVTRAYTGVSVL